MIDSPFPTFSYEEDPTALLALQDRKNRPVQSCTECRRRKQKCDRQLPCGNCVTRGEISKCVEYRKDRDETITDKPLFPSLDDFDTLVRRVRDLESHIRLSESRDGGTRAQARTRSASRIDLEGASFAVPFPDLPVGIDNDRHQRAVSFDYLPSAAAASTDGRHLMAQDEHNDMQRQPTREASPDMTNYNDSMALEDVAFSRTQNLERREHLFNTRHRSSETAIDTGRLSSSILVKDSIPTHSAGEVDVKDVMRTMRDLMDGATEFKVMLYFLEEIEWLFRCIHIPTFQSRYRDLQEGLHLGLSRLSVEQASFLALCAACLCVALHLMDENRLASINITLWQRDGLARAYNDLTETLFHKIDWAQNHRIETLQAFIIIGEYWHSYNLSERHWSLLGTAVKVAQNIGMSRLGPEPTGVVTESLAKARYGSRWAAAADRETARRVWFSLLEMDCTYAPEHNFTYIVQWDRQRSIEPANVNDQELLGFGPVCSHPLSRHTDMTFFLNRLHFIYPVRDFVDLVVGNDGVRYEFVEETHKSLIAATGRLSPFYRVSADPEAFARDAKHATRLIAEQRAINCHGHLRILRLHRIYLGQSYKSAKFALSRDSVTQSVRFITEKHLNKRDRANIPLRYWSMNYGLLTATIALFIGFCHSGVEENLTELRHCLSALKLQSGCSSLIVSATTLETLLEDELAHKQSSRQVTFETSRKRKGPAESLQDNLNKANRPFRMNENESQRRDLAQSAVSAAHLQTASHIWPDNQSGVYLPGSTANKSTHADRTQFAVPLQPDVTHQGAFDPGLFDPNFHTEDANLLEFFRYGLAQWPEDTTNIWPPVNDFGSGGG